MAIPVKELADELYESLFRQATGQGEDEVDGRAMAVRGKDWLEVAQAIKQIAELTGVRVDLSYKLASDVMCAKINGCAVEINAVEVENRDFSKLYDAMKDAMRKVGIPDPERFLTKPSEPTATEIRMQMQLREQQMKLARAAAKKMLADNGYVNEMNTRYMNLAQLKTEGGVIYDDPADDPSYLPRVVYEDRSIPQEPRDVALIPVQWGEPAPRLDVSETEVEEPSPLPGRKVML